MSAASLRRLRARFQPYAVLLGAAIVFALLPVVSSGSVSRANVYNVLQNFAALGLVTLGLGLTMICGEFDLSVSSTYLLGGMIAIRTGASHPLLGVLLAVAVCLTVGAAQGALVARLRMSSMPITLGGFIALLGLVFVISGNKSLSYANATIGPDLDKPILQIFSLRSLLAIAIFATVAFVLSFTSLGRNIRAIGSDRAASQVAGVRVGTILIAVFAASAALSSLGGSLLAYSLAYSSPDQTVAPLIFAATAALLGGVPLSGGRGTAFGIAAGVISLSLVGEALVVIAAAPYVTSLVTGGLLLLVAVIAAPDLTRQWKALGGRSTVAAPAATAQTSHEEGV
jgi:ribose transport system permease protein